MYSKVVVEREQEVQGPTYHCCCPICGAVIGTILPDQQPEPWQELKQQRVDHINATHRIDPDYPYPDFAAWEGEQSLRAAVATTAR
jgi:hypothetical protein